MNNNSVLKLDVLFFQIILILLLVFAITYLIKAKHNIRLENKFSKYTIKRLNNNTVSILDNIFKCFEFCVKKCNILFEKSKLLVKYSLRYEKHIYYEELGDKKGIDYISLKFLVGIIISLVYLLDSVFKYTSISFVSLFCTFILGFFAVDLYLYISYTKKRKEISEDLLKAIMIMNNAFKSGKSITQAIKTVSSELDGAISDEFKKISRDITYGLSLEVVFERFYERVKLEDAKYIITSLTILNKTGGNIIKVFESIEREFINRKKLQNELKSLTATSVFVFRTLLVMPLILFIVIYSLNNDYFSPFFSSSVGALLFILICLIYAVYIVVIKNILRIDL